MPTTADVNEREFWAEVENLLTECFEDEFGLAEPEEEELDLESAEDLIDEDNAWGIDGIDEDDDEDLEILEEEIEDAC